MSVYTPPYATGAQVLDCEDVKNGYQKPSYSADPTCNNGYPNCDVRSYSSFATDSAYQGYYDFCLTAPANTQCDLKYLSAPPKVDIGCWPKCCDKQMSNCNQACHESCVINAMSGPKPTVPPVPKK